MSVTTTAGSVAELAGATKTFGSGDTDVHALVDVDLALSPGELVVVLGPSGSGNGWVAVRSAAAGGRLTHGAVPTAR